MNSACTIVNRCFIILILTASSVTNYSPLSATTGKPCFSGSNGEPGQCVPLSECPQLWKGVKKNNEAIQVCGIDKQSPLVCCGSKPHASPMPSHEALPLSYGSSIVAPKSDISISKKKCREYAKFVYEKSDVTGESSVARCSIRPGRQRSGKAAFGEFPHMASLVYQDQDNSTFNGCGGSLISERYVLTAAHCLIPLGHTLAWVLLGAVDIEEGSNQGELIPISKKIIHPDYKRPRKYFDVGLVQLKRAPTLGPLLRPACLPDDADNFDSKGLLLTGWGATGFAEDPSTDLLKTTLIEAPYQICSPHYQRTQYHRHLPLGIHNASMICAGHPTGKSDACQGDSGGPIQVTSMDPDCTYTIVGVTSFGPPCGLGAHPGVYGRVQYFRKWIENIVWR